MLLSMTGFGEARCQRDGLAVAVEVRTINSRYFKISVRSSEGYSALEPKIESVVRERVRRGTVQVNLRVEHTRAPEDYLIDARVLDGYRRQYGISGVFVLPVNLYGPHDNFDLHSSHVIPALIRKCVEAIERGDDEIVCWGSGKISREFLYVDDAAEGVLRATETLDEPIPVNLGTCREITIKDLVDLIVKLTGFTGRVRWDASKPDGQPRRSVDASRARELFGFEARTDFRDGLRQTIDWYLANRDHAESRTT